MKELSGALSWPIFTMDIRYEQDVVQARQRARQIASHLHYDLQELTRIATAVSELVRYAYKNGFTQANFTLVEKKFRVAVWGALPEQGDIKAKWTDKNISNDARSLGLIGARKLMDEFSVALAPGPVGQRPAGARPPAQSTGRQTVPPGSGRAAPPH